MDEKEAIKRILTSKFEVDLFEASLESLAERHNRLRYNNFAYSIRELSRHFLNRLAPEDNVKACSWYKDETMDGKLTRVQRIKYAIQGGISNELLDRWGFDLDELENIIKDIKSSIDSLNKYTHINPDVFDLNDDEVEQNSLKVLCSFKAFIETIEIYRLQLREFFRWLC